MTNKAEYVTINELTETTAASLSDDAEIMINNSSEAVPATKAKLSTLLAKTKASIANLDGNIVEAQGEIEALQTGKANTALDNIPTNYDYVIESQTLSDGSFYRKYKSGWLEQGNMSSVTTGNSSDFTQDKTITFPKPFASTNYTLIGPGFFIANAGRQDVTRTATGFTTSSYAQFCGTSYWYACGQGAN